MCVRARTHTRVCVLTNHPPRPPAAPYAHVGLAAGAGGSKVRVDIKVVASAIEYPALPASHDLSTPV